ncbi:DUF4421 domain-containing protein [Bacteroides caecigallinarum]|uniref:DUF4421 domain-containing protein n=1 Tax=Bacteroides caecigallinarum TaxID=1411144 RepID=UPI0019560C9C|nr:DUF4421 domain-containing protein [Bacteroides caecigallinarum]MBM6961304.1 DUF4421 domain-containing protein [Bacteroides caecigallinarum]
MSARILLVSATILFLLIPRLLKAQNEEKECVQTAISDSLNCLSDLKYDNQTSPFKKFFNRSVEWFNATDTNYIQPNKYNLTMMLEQSTWFEHYRLSGTGENGNQLLGFAPKVNTKLGVYFGWRWIFLGYSFDLASLFKKEREKPRTEMVFNLYSAKFGVDLYYRKTGSNFRITTCKNFDNAEKYIGTNFNGFNSKIKGLNAYYIFNSEKYSYPAAYSQSTNQKKSCGSLMAGFAFSQHDITFDQSKLPQEIKDQIRPSLNFNKLAYTDFNLSLGYGYNWVFAKNCLLNISLLPAIGYKKARINDTLTTPNSDWTQWVKDINFDLITRAGITWNNSKYYVGATLILHTYDYRKDNFSMTNSFGSLKIYAGFNFWKRKQYRRPE